ncbi:MAG TPA: glycosyltransferase [Roseiflexaceae bacterium]
MRILYLTPYVPSLVRVRPYQFIRHLAELGHDVTLICLAGRDEEPAALDELRAWCHEVVTVPASKRQAAIQALRALPSSLPLQAAYGASEALVEQARRRADRHDVVHIEHLRGSTYGVTLCDYPRLLDAVDCISLLFERAFRQSVSIAGRVRALLDLARTRHAEGRFGATFRQVVVTSPEDRWALRQLQSPDAPTPRIDVIANGVDLTAFVPAPPAARQSATLLLSGKMSYHANEASAIYLGRVIMPLIWRERPDARCMIVGRAPTPAVCALAADARITVTGAVPSMAPFLSSATIAAVPLRYGVGIQNKVLEAMATATPVVATPQAANALNTRPGEEIMLAATPEAFAATVLELLDDPERRANLGAAGRRYVETHHDWHAGAGRLIELYRDISNRRAAAHDILPNCYSWPDRVHP